VWERSRYEQLFSGAGGLLTGEASTIYLGSRSAARAVGRELPEARAIAVLRDPVDRAYSAYLHLRRDGWEPHADFAEALAAEPDRIERGYAPLWLYRSRGMYGEQLEDWLEAVGERRLLLLRYDELLREPVATVRSAWRFLGLDDSGTPSVTRLNPAGQVRSARLRDALIRPSGAKRLSRRLLPAAARRRAWRALMTRNTRPTEQRIEERVADRLRASFQSDIERVEMLTGWDLGSWKTGSPR
jgi:hypothetical protein